MHLIGAMILLAIVLTCVVHVDRVVTSVAGIIMTSSGSLYVDPLNPSVVRQVNVKVGQIVKKGQALATLDPTFTQADLIADAGAHGQRSSNCRSRTRLKLRTGRMCFP